MKQYHDLLNAIREEGTYKEPARENMPTTTSLFGYQMGDFHLGKGFPILTTKEVNFKHIVTELLWFLRGDTNVRYLNENKCGIWNQDSYNYYLKVIKNADLSWKEYRQKLKEPEDLENRSDIYNYGDCGYQYGKVWRDFHGTDQIARVVDNLLNRPEGRRHVISAVDPSNDDNLALYWCHSLFQFNARPIRLKFRMVDAIGKNPQMFGDADLGIQVFEDKPGVAMDLGKIGDFIKEKGRKYCESILDQHNEPKYRLDCKMYQRSADVFLGVPYNISSYALLTHIMARITGMIPGKYIHTFGDVHIYSDHNDQVDEILGNDYNKYPLPKIKFSERFDFYLDKFLGNTKVTAEIDGVEMQVPSIDYGYFQDFDAFIHEINPDDIYLEGYQSYDKIKAPLSTGIKK